MLLVSISVRKTTCGCVYGMDAEMRLRDELLALVGDRIMYI